MDFAYDYVNAPTTLFCRRAAPCRSSNWTSDHTNNFDESYCHDAAHVSLLQHGVPVRREEFALVLPDYALEDAIHIGHRTSVPCWRPAASCTGGRCCPRRRSPAGRHLPRTRHHRNGAGPLRRCGVVRRQGRRAKPGHCLRSQRPFGPGAPPPPAPGSVDAEFPRPWLSSPGSADIVSRNCRTPLRPIVMCISAALAAPHQGAYELGSFSLGSATGAGGAAGRSAREFPGWLALLSHRVPI